MNSHFRSKTHINKSVTLPKHGAQIRRRGPQQGGPGKWSDDPIIIEAMFSLEPFHRAFGITPEQPIGLEREAPLVKLYLEGFHLVAQFGRGVIKPIIQAEYGMAHRQTLLSDTGFPPSPSVSHLPPHLTSMGWSYGTVARMAN